jgi:large conductance mechanosensitive channel
MSLASEFKAFIMRGNVVDLAVGVVIGAAFGTIVSSMVDDILMPPIASMTGGIDFSDKAIQLPGSVKNEKGELVPVMWRYGKFVQAIIKFLIVGVCLFLVVKGMNKMKKKEEAKPAEPSSTDKLLMEIRDNLKK